MGGDAHGLVSWGEGGIPVYIAHVRAASMTLKSMALCAASSAPVDAGAIETDEDAQIDTGPCRAPGAAVAASPIVLQLQQRGQDALLLLVLRFADAILVVARHDGRLQGPGYEASDGT